MATSNLSQYEAALAARNQAIDAKIEQQLQATSRQQAAPLEHAVADALRHVLKTAEVVEGEEDDWEAPGGSSTAAGPCGWAADGPHSELDAAGGAAQEGLPPQAELRLYKARVKALYSDISTLQTQAKEKDKRLDALEKELRQLQADKAAWAKQQKALESQVDKLRQAAEDARARLQEKENMIKDLGRDRQASQQERKQAEAEMKARDARLAGALKELERYRKLLEQAKAQAAGAGGEVSRDDYNRVVVENKRLEQQKHELVSAFKKAMKLVDVLKRQKLHLEAACLLDVAGKELVQAMDLGK